MSAGMTRHALAQLSSTSLFSQQATQNDAMPLLSVFVLSSDTGGERRLHSELTVAQLKVSPISP